MTHEPDSEVSAPVWSPDSSKLLYQIRNVNSYLIDANRPGTEQSPQSLPGNPPLGFIPWHWSPDGKLLVGNYALSRDNKRLYYPSASNEADIWLLKVESSK